MLSSGRSNRITRFASAGELGRTHEAKTHLSEYINRVRYRGERILIAPPASRSRRSSARSTFSFGVFSGGERRGEISEALEKADIRVSWPGPGKRVLRERPPVKVEGAPLRDYLRSSLDLRRSLETLKTTPAYFFDTSAAVSVCREEEGLERAEEILLRRSSIRKRRFYPSRVGGAEVVAAFFGKTKTGQMEVEDAIPAAEDLRAHVNDVCQIVEVSHATTEP